MGTSQNPVSKPCHFRVFEAGIELSPFLTHCSRTGSPTTALGDDGEKQVLRDACIFIILLAALFLTSCSQPADEVQGLLTCEYFGRTDQTLAIRMDDGDLVRLVDMDFRLSPFVPTLLSCQQWLDGLSIKDRFNRAWRVRPTLSKEGFREGRLLGAERMALYVNCERSSLCRVRFPYDIGWWRVKEMFERTPPSPFGLSEQLCATPVQDVHVEKPALTDVPLLSTGDLTNIDVWSSPPDDFADHVVTLIRGMDRGTLFVSTMTVDHEQVEKIAAELGDRPLLTIYLLFDMPTNIAAYDIHQWLPYESDQLHFVPIAPRPDMPTFYHLKGAASLGGNGRFVFTSLNLTGNEDRSLYDLGFNAKGKAVDDALAKVFANQIEKACAEPEYLSCTLGARTRPEDPLRHELRASLAVSCSAFYDSDLPRQVRDLTNPYFIATSDADAVSLLTDVIKSSRASIQAYAHRVDSWPMLFALDEAKKRGVEANVFAGRAGDHPTWKTPKFEGLLHTLEDKAAGSAHAKFVLVDGTRAFWGTGNLTKNGLQDAAEVFFLTDNPTLIQALKDYARYWDEAGQNISPN